MSIWFEGSNEINSTIEQLKKSLGNLGEHYVGIVKLMSVLTNIELVEQENDFLKSGKLSLD